MHYSASYLVLSAWGATPGQAEIRQASLAEAAGRVYPTADPEAGFTGCFECHSTGPVSFDDTGEARTAEPGVHCEVCHRAGALHSMAPSRRNIRNPKNLSADQLNQLWGTCHRKRRWPARESIGIIPGMSGPSPFTSNELPHLPRSARSCGQKAGRLI